MKMERRAKFLLAAAAAAAVAGVALEKPAPAPAAPLISTPTSNEQQSDFRAKLPARADLSKPHGDMFAAWPSAPSTPPPQPAVQVWAPPAPPPVPYRFAGHLTHDGAKQHFVMKGDVLLPVEQGETVDGTYRVEAVAADEIVLLYIPLGVRTRLGFSYLPDNGGSAMQASIPAPNILPSASQPIASQSAEPGSAAAAPLRAAQLRGPRTQPGPISQ